MSNRDNQIQKHFDIDDNGHLTPEHHPPTGIGPGRYPDGIGLNAFHLLAFTLLLGLILTAVIVLRGGG